MGALKNGFNDMKSHAFFETQNMDFEKILNQEILMPYIPNKHTDSRDNVTTSIIEEFNITDELNCAVENEYNEYFDNILSNTPLQF